MKRAPRIFRRFFNPFGAGIRQARIRLKLRMLERAFDQNYYVAAYPEVAGSCASPLRHFLETGWKEFRNPSQWFDTHFYCKTCPEVTKSGINPLWHYLSIGKMQGKPPRPEPGSVDEWTSHAIRLVKADEIEKVAGHFDSKFYLETYPDILQAGIDPLLHYVAYGWKELRRPNRDFDPVSYSKDNAMESKDETNPFLHFLAASERNQNLRLEHSELSLTWVRDIIEPWFDDLHYMSQAEIIDGHIDPISHYIQVGWKDGLDPSPTFDVSYYLDSNQDVAKSKVEPYSHFLLTGKGEGRSPLPPEVLAEAAYISETIRPEFDADFYRETYPLNDNIDPVMHYVLAGWKQGLNPNREFQLDFYLKNNKDVAAAGCEPFFHFVTNGRREGRLGAPGAPTTDEGSPEYIAAKGYFDEKYYRSVYPDLAGVDDVFEHYMVSGWREGRNPSRDFETTFYLEANPDIRDAGVNPLAHYALAGVKEGRLCQSPGGYRARALKNLRTVEDRVAAWKIDQPTAGSFSALDRSLKKALSVSKEARLIISISHDNYVTNTGGIQACIQEEQQRFNEAGDVYFHIHPCQPLPTLAEPDHRNWIGSVIINGDLVGSFECEDINKALKTAVKRHEALIVVHALHGHAPEWIESLVLTCAPTSTYYWLHDYFSLCVGYNLLRNDVTFCGAPSLSSNACGICVYGEHRRLHLERMRRLFKRLKCTIISPSAVALSLWKDKTDLPFDDAVVHEHRVLIPTSKTTPAADAVVRIAFLGYPSLHKGWGVYQELVESLSDDNRYEFFHLGLNPDPSLAVSFSPVRLETEGENAMREAVMRNKIDFVFVASLWPETFCLTAYEGLAGGAEIITVESSGNVHALASTRQGSLAMSSSDSLLDAFTKGLVAVRAKENRKLGRQLYSLACSGVTAGLIGATRSDREYAKV